MQGAEEWNRRRIRTRRIAEEVGGGEKKNGEWRMKII
jgi:hypothetical protein